MQNFQIHFAGLSPTLNTVGLISMYNTHIYGYYNNPPIVRRTSLQKKESDMHCMIITLEGNVDILLHNRKTVRLTEKSIFFSKYSEIAQMQHRETHWHFVCCWFVSQSINIPVNKIYYFPDMNIQQEDAEASRIIRWAQTKITHKIQYANSYFCCRLLDILEKTQQRNPTNQEFIDQVLAYIHRHIEDNIQVNDLANHFHFSEKHIHHLFKNAFSDTPKKFINSTKLTYIQYLLTSTNLSLQELTDKYKYSSVSHLIKCFKQKYGITPTEYRNNHYQ